MLTGIALGFSTAWVWATSSLWIKAQSARVHPLAFNAFRMTVATLFFMALLPFFGGWDAFVAVPVSSSVMLALSTIVGITFGDSLYFWSMNKIGTSRALPISGIYPLFTWAIAVPLLGEPITAR